MITTAIVAGLVDVLVEVVRLVLKRKACKEHDLPRVLEKREFGDKEVN